MVTTITLYAGTNASPTQSLARAAPTSLPTNATGLDCFPPVLIGSRQATTRDCLYAVLLLPEGSAPGYFHNYGRDEYALPVVKHLGSCMVTVSLSGSNPDYSSWHRISHAASQLTSVCAVGQFPLGMTGGIIYVGTKGKIRVTVERSQAVILNVGNGTVEVVAADQDLESKSGAE